MKKANFTFLIMLMLMGFFHNSANAQCGPGEDMTAPVIACSANPIGNPSFDMGPNASPPQGWMNSGLVFQEFINSPNPATAPTSGYGKMFGATSTTSQVFPAIAGENWSGSMDMVVFSFDQLGANTTVVVTLSFLDANGVELASDVSAVVDATTVQNTTVPNSLNLTAPASTASVSLGISFTSYDGGAIFFDNAALSNNTNPMVPMIEVEATASLSMVSVTSPAVSDNCPGAVNITNDFNNTADASGDYPLGTTTVTFTATDAAGNANAIPCTFEITVNDTVAPTLDICSGDVLVNGQFEDGNTGGGIQDWATFGNVFTEFINSPAPATSASGRYVKMFGQFTGGENVGGFFQEFPAAPGETWSGSMDMVNFSFDAMQPNNFAVVKLVYQDAGGTELAAVESAPLNDSSPQNVTIPNALSLEAPAGTAKVLLFGLFIQAPGGTAPLFNGGATFFSNAVLNKPAATVSAEAALGDCDAMVTVPVPVATDATTVTLVNSIDGDEDATGTYEVGTTLVSYTGTDEGGNTVTCTQTVSVLLANAPVGTVCVCEGDSAPGGALACNDVVNVSAGANCLVVISPDLILESPAAGCYNITVDGETTNVIDASDMLGESFVVMISSEDGNSCWGSIVIEDKAAPVLTCEDVTVDCTMDNLTGVETNANTGLIIADDNCSGSATTISLIDQSINDDEECGTGVIITRQYIAIDGVGNISEPCTQTITIVRVTDVDFPADVEIECSSYAANNDLVAPTAAGTGIPSVATGTYCNFAASSSDELLELCGNDTSDDLFKIVRTWTVLDWCAGTLVTTGANGEDNVQIIKVSDTTAPVITVSNQTVSASIAGVHPQPCTSQSILATAVVSDNCSATTIEIFTPVGPVTSTGAIPAPGLSIGDHLVTYVASDACGNTSELTVIVTVVDDVTPTPVCDEITQVAIGADGIATVLAETFDDGSNDNCGIDGFAVRRMADACAIAGNTTFGPSVKFCCADVGTTVMVAFQVTDYFGNTNQCMVEVLVEDKLAPFKTQDVVDSQIACDNYFNNFAPALDIAEANGDLNPAVLVAAFGDVSYDDNCGAIVTVGFSRNVNTCGIGTITRTWSVVDAAGNVGQSCSQTIDVFTVNDWGVTFPADQDAVCVAGQDELGGVNFGEPVVFDDDCELIAISVEDQLFNVVPDACYKVIRTYTAINWCVYDGDNDDDDIEFSSPLNPDGDARRFRDTNDGIIVYLQTIKVQDDIAPVITNPGNQDYCIDGSTDADGDCDRSIELPEAVVTDCSDNITTTYSVAGLGTGRNYSNVAPGTYEVTVTSLDNCGNQSTITYDAIVRDCKAPTPYCVGGLVVELMPDGNGGGMVELWSSDFNAGSFDNCTAQENLLLTSTNDVDDFSMSTTNITFDCSDVGPNGVYLYIQDEAGNVDYCLTTVFIESVPNVCPTTPGGDDPVIAGIVATENDAPVAGVTVGMDTTDEEGAYSTTAVAGDDVTVSPEYNVYDNSSVTTFDLLTIRKHILTTELLTSPYKMIAADINNNQAITAADLVAARQVILGMATSYPNNNAWTFVDAAYSFPANWSLTDGYPAINSINNIEGNANVNFVAVRVGDVNGTFGFADSADERNSMIINANDATLVAGQEVTVEFSAADAVLGYQFTLNFENLEVVSIDGNEENFGVFAKAITTSFDAAASDRLFSVTFKATADVTVSEAIVLTSNITRAEAYSANGAMNIALEFANTSADFALFQNTPNPVNDFTKISFNLPTAGTAAITVSDMTGKVVSVINGEYTKGYNEVTLSNLPAGVLTYTLANADFTATKTMVVVK